MKIIREISSIKSIPTRYFVCVWMLIKQIILFSHAFVLVFNEIYYHRIDVASGGKGFTTNNFER